MYEKVGFDVIRPNCRPATPNNIGLTDQKSGFGFIHDGAVSLTEFLAAPRVHQHDAAGARPVRLHARRSRPSRSPAVGRQETVTAANKNNGAVITTINTLIAQAEAGNCDVIVKGVARRRRRRAASTTERTNQLRARQPSETPSSEAALRASVGGTT